MDHNALTEDSINNKGENALFTTTNSLMVKTLIDKGANVNQINNQGLNALMVNRCASVQLALIENGIDTNYINKDGVNALWYVEDHTVFTVLLNVNVNINQRSRQGSSLLFPASYFSEIKFLIDSGIDINIKDSEGETAIFSADEPDIIDLYLKHGMDIYNSNGDTPVSIINMDLSHECFKVFAKYGIYRDSKNKTSVSPLFDHLEDFEYTKKLLQEGADPNSTSFCDMPLLIYYLIYVKHPHKSNIKLYVEFGADVNSTDRFGRHSLFYACTVNKYDLLVSLGAKSDHKDKLGRIAKRENL